MALWNHALTQEEITEYSYYAFNRWNLALPPVLDLNGQAIEAFAFSDNGRVSDVINIAEIP